MPTPSERTPKRILMIAYHFPPFSGSSGIQRTLSFTRYLPAHGWQPIILTAQERAYPQVSLESLSDVPPRVIVSRAFALDSARHLSMKGRYFQFTALPDRWLSWVLGAVPSGLSLIRKYRPSVLWSTFPIATAHLIGLILHRITGLPWVADFRDPMTEGEVGVSRHFPENPTVWKARRWVEKLTVRHCTRAVLVSPGALEIYSKRYSEVSRSQWSLISNGYDEDSFLKAERLGESTRLNGHPITLIHSGLLYPTMGDRNPSAFFRALEMLKSQGKISPARVKVILRASGSESEFEQLIRKHGIKDIVSLEPSIPYTHALAEMLQAGGLLVFQGPISNPNIPAKLYEYIRARRPILALVDPAGNTAEVLREVGTGTIVSIDNASEIADGLLSFLDQVGTGVAPVHSIETALGYSRESRTAELAQILDEIAD